MPTDSSHRECLSSSEKWTRVRPYGVGRFCFGLHLRMQKPMPAGGDKGVKVPDPEVGEGGS